MLACGGQRGEKKSVMIDIKLIRSNPELIKAGAKKRNYDADKIVDDILAIDAKRREITAESEAKRAEQNAASKKIPQMKKEGGDVSELMAQMKALSAEVKESGAKLDEIEEATEDAAAEPAEYAGRGRCGGRQGKQQAASLF